MVGVFFEMLYWVFDGVVVCELCYVSWFMFEVDVLLCGW